mgnify:CR=1 FL=1
MPATPRRVAVRQHAYDGQELLIGKFTVWPGLSHQGEERINLQLLVAGHGDDLLGQDVQRLARGVRRFDFAAQHAALRKLPSLAADPTGNHQFATVIGEDDPDIGAESLIIDPVAIHRNRIKLFNCL